jgi:hypothetical protein
LVPSRVKKGQAREAGEGDDGGTLFDKCLQESHRPAIH